MRPMMRVMLAQAAGGGGGGSNGFTGQYTITIDHTQAGSADTSNFPFLFRSTLAPLKTTANGGDVTSASGYDLVFCSDAGLTTPLDFEIESYDGATGTFLAWVRVPTLSHTSDTVLYLGYGKSSITTDQSNRTGVWDANFGAVYHFGSTLTVGGYPADTRQDSTANANALANGASAVATATGQVGVELDATNAVECLAAADAASLKPTAALTVECWGRPGDTSDYRTFVGKGTRDTLRNYWLGVQQTSGHAAITVTKGGVFYTAEGTTVLPPHTSPGSTDHHVVGTYDGSNLRLYVDGALEATTALTGTLDSSTASLIIGYLEKPSLAFRLPLGGYVDEVRLSSAARLSSYITASYNNQQTGSTFYAVT